MSKKNKLEFDPGDVILSYSDGTFAVVKEKDVKKIGAVRDVRCGTCKHWSPGAHGSNVGYCLWHKGREIPSAFFSSSTFADDGAKCACWEQRT